MGQRIPQQLISAHLSSRVFFWSVFLAKPKLWNKKINHCFYCSNSLSQKVCFEHFVITRSTNFYNKSCSKKTVVKRNLNDLWLHTPITIECWFYKRVVWILFKLQAVVWQKIRANVKITDYNVSNLHSKQIVSMQMHSCKYSFIYLYTILFSQRARMEQGKSWRNQ